MRIQIALSHCMETDRYHTFNSVVLGLLVPFYMQNLSLQHNEDIYGFTNRQLVNGNTLVTKLCGGEKAI